MLCNVNASFRTPSDILPIILNYNLIFGRNKSFLQKWPFHQFIQVFQLRPKHLLRCFTPVETVHYRFLPTHRVTSHQKVQAHILFYSQPVFKFTMFMWVMESIMTWTFCCACIAWVALSCSDTAVGLLMWPWSVWLSENPMCLAEWKSVVLGWVKM